MKTIHVLAALLVVSVAANIVTFAIYVPQQQGIISNLVEKTNSLTTENMQLHRQLDQANTRLFGLFIPTLVLSHTIPHFRP